MSPDIKQLYQEVIIDHSKNPRNAGRLREISHEAHGDNPVCGYKIDVFVQLKDDRIVDVTFEGAGCAITTASASIMTEEIKGKSLKDVQKLIKKYYMLLGVGLSEESDNLGDLSEHLKVFESVKDFPGRVKCASLAWHTLEDALGLKSAAKELE